MIFLAISFAVPQLASLLLTEIMLSIILEVVRFLGVSTTDELDDSNSKADDETEYEYGYIDDDEYQYRRRKRSPENKGPLRVSSSLLRRRCPGESIPTGPHRPYGWFR